MFSYLSRGYGTWEGIAKLEKPDSAIAPNHGNYDILPPIQKDQYNFYDQHFDHDGLYKIPQEELKFPEMPKNSVHIPKTYSTKSGALLLYSEGCFVPGSRRLKKRPRFKRQKEQRLQTLKDFMDLIMDYKKNGCDPLLLEQLWRRMSGSARDVQPGYSPKRYLGHLSHTFDPEQWRKLIETGSLKSFGTADDCYLPSLLPEYDDHLNHRPPPYKTMSLPPVSPSSSMLGSFTFYKHALSTGAASMVSLPSIDSDTIDNQLSANTAGTFVESLAERLAEVESEAGFKKDYETLTAKEKEDLLTQLLMDVTLHNQGDVITVPTQTVEDSSTVNTDMSYLSETKGSKSLESYHSAKTLPSEKTRSITSNKSTKSSTSKKSLRSSQRPKSDDTSKSLKSVPSRTTSVCSLPPIVPKENAPDSVDVENSSKKASLSSSRSGLSIVVDDFEIGLNGIDIEINDNSFYLAEDTDFGMERKDSETRSLRSEKSFSEHSLIDALNIQDGESLHQLTDETKSLKSLASSDGLINRTGRIGERLSSDGVIGESKTADGDLANGMVHGDYGVSDGILSGDGGDVLGGDGSDGDGSSVGTGYCVASGGDGGGKYGDDIGDGAVYGVGSDGGGVASDGSGDGYAYSENEGDGLDSISISSDGHPDYHHEPTKQTQAPHMSLSSLQDEVRLVATEVLSRPKSGRILAEDAEMATLLLLERMQGLLDPALTENARASSAVLKKVRPLGQPRNSEAKGKRRVRSAEATLASRKLVSPEEKQVEQVSKSEEEPAEQVSSKEQEPHVEDDSLSKTDESDLSVDDVIVTMDTVQDIGPVKKDGAQSLEVGSTTPSPEGELLTVKDLLPDKKQEETSKPDVTKVKETKENVQKGGKVKKGGNAKRVAKGKKKRASIARARNEPPKTPPFRAGLVPESKPPKGLEENTDGAPKKGKQASPDLHEKTQPKTTDPDKISEIDVHPPGIPARVDAETGEVEHKVSPARPEKSPSLTGRKTPPEEKKSVSREDQLSARAQTGSPRAQNGSPRAQIDSPREKSPHEKTPSSRDKTPSSRDKTPSSRDKTPSSRDKTPSSRDKTPSSRDKTPSPREQKPSPREQKACPRDRDAVFNETVNANRENVNTNVVTESVASTREPSPELVLTEKQRRANARTAQRAAAAERRRQEVERKRREREEARKRAQEEEARLEVLRKESEEEMKRREEERRIQKEQEERERMRLDTEQNERARQERLMIERQRQAREDWKRKKEQLMAQRQFEEELRKERECVELQIEEERRREYAEKIAHLEEEERERLMEERRLEEERIKREIQEEKERREAERLRMLEERRQMEEDLAAASERQLARRTFLETLLRDFQNLLLDQRITRAFTFSYFDIMPWFKDRWRDLEEDRPSSKRPSTQLDTVPEESEIDLEQAV